MIPSDIPIHELLGHGSYPAIQVLSLQWEIKHPIIQLIQQKVNTKTFLHNTEPFHQT